MEKEFFSYSSLISLDHPLAEPLITLVIIVEVVLVKRRQANSTKRIHQKQQQQQRTVTLRVSVTFFRFFCGPPELDCSTSTVYTDPVTRMS